MATSQDSKVLTAVAEESETTDMDERHDAGYYPDDRPDAPRLPVLSIDELLSKPDEELTEYRKWGMYDFEIGKPLGSGRFGQVFLVREFRTEAKMWFAMKVLFKKQLVKYSMETQFRREIEIQFQLSHPNIVSLFTWFHRDDKIFLILDWARYGDLFTYLTRHKRFSERRGATYTAQITDALQYCHSKKIIHRDLKPENVMVGWDGEAMLADFGWAAHAAKGRRTKTNCGTTEYMAPELTKRLEYTHTVDNWCIGIFCYELLKGKSPFESSSVSSTIEKISRIDYTFPEYFNPGARDLISRLLVKNPSARLSLKDVLKHPWIEKNRVHGPLLFPEDIGKAGL